MSRIAHNLANITQRVQQAASECGRNWEEIQLLAVSKTHSVDDIRAAYEAGIRCFGESYLQEALPKISALQDLPLEWHYIGPIQSNKTRAIAEHFDWVHSIDRFKVALRLSEQRPANLTPLNICIQVNISQETGKSGIIKEALRDFAQQLVGLPRLQLRGLMAIPQKTDNQHQQRAVFAQLRGLLDDLNQQGFQLDTLSMGMSNDFEAAILEGATIVRIGTGIFGPRNVK